MSGVLRRGAFVVQPSVQDIEEIFELREALVVKNATLDEKGMARMRTAVMSAKKYREANVKANYIRADSSLHSPLAEASSNSRLKKILENMPNQMLIVRSRTFELSSYTSVKQHLDIVEALEQGKRELAARLTAEHICSLRARHVSHMREQQNGDKALEIVAN